MTEELTLLEQLRQQASRELPAAITITFVHDASPNQDYTVRFGDRLDGRQENVLREIMALYDGKLGTTHTLDDSRRVMTVTFIGGDGYRMGVTWLHSVFKPHVPATATLEVRGQGERLNCRLVFLNYGGRDQRDELRQSLEALDVVSQVDTGGDEDRPMTIYLPKGLTPDQIMTALNQEVAGTTPVRRMVSIGIIDMRRTRT